jgi:hypothetical protein
MLISILIVHAVRIKQMALHESRRHLLAYKIGTLAECAAKLRQQDCAESFLRREKRELRENSFHFGSRMRQEKYCRTVDEESP